MVKTKAFVRDEAIKIFCSQQKVDGSKDILVRRQIFELFAEMPENLPFY